ncbi:YkgJ family cysteine cluster protein [Methanocella arvoryzae]|uniref:Fe-S-cluster oxidoreductase n=1 Tax=Methanocella arvoryzae (strain DSM 22066 / NBRC 105507 / MRE50) TaxID=351160 RepID=Q0W703_METAR|nr:zinc/iron-chelating domain-containing protein [Methanocella arvoryzae]CAJ35840.1 hypothetical protein RCIX401 [Methanocella arvoryzae MRE50]
MLSRQEFFTQARNGPYAQCSTEQLYYAYEVYQICPLSRDPVHISHVYCGRCGNCCRRQWRIEVSLEDVQRWIDECRFDIIESLERQPQKQVPSEPGRSIYADEDMATLENGATHADAHADAQVAKAMAIVRDIASGRASYVIPKTRGCKYLIDGEITMCSIYDTRPEVCRNFPSVESA